MVSGLTIFSTFTIALSVVTVLLGVYVYNGGFWQSNTVPQVEPLWWGRGHDSPTEKQDTSVRPFKINVSEATLQDLNRRLDATRPPAAALEGIHFQYGFNPDTLAKLVHYWRHEYKWREREAFFNRYPHFKTRIQGLDLHFLHVKPPGAGKTVPLLLLHGWPGSVREFYSLIELLMAPGAVRFELVVPSLPGYGWSEPAARPGLGAAHMAQLMAALMQRLGHDSWYVQGGDWGSAIGSFMATLYPERVLGLHINMCMVNSPAAIFRMALSWAMPSLFGEAGHRDRDSPFSKMFTFMLEEGGYMHLQATKPDTVGVALMDSPAGLAAYLLEKFSTWTDPAGKRTVDGGLGGRFSYDELLDNVMVYWVTGSITTSMRLYAESFGRKERELGVDVLPVTVPTACAKFAHELMYQPDSVLRLKYTNLVQSHEFQEGGHFAAMELPTVMAEDIVQAITTMQAHR